MSTWLALAIIAAAATTCLVVLLVLALGAMHDRRRWRARMDVERRRGERRGR